MSSVNSRKLMRNRASLPFAAGALSIAMVGCVPGLSTSGPSAPTTLLTRLGADTVSIEQYTRSPTHVEGVIVSHSPSTSVIRYSVEIGANNTPTSAEWSVRRADGTPVPTAAIPSASLRFGADSARIVGHRASGGDTTRVLAAKNEQYPYIGSSYGLFELAIVKLRASGRDSGDFAYVPFAVGASAANAITVRLVGADSARVLRFGSWLPVRHERGTITGVNGLATTLKVRVERVANTDLDAIARAWAAKDQIAGAMGASSTRDTVRATIGTNTHLWVDYGRPSLRGRDVWVNGVLGDTIWRTGANAATQFNTDADVVIGGVAVPAGTYTLWTRTTPIGYDLIINKQVGQWGTEYHADRDLARIPLQVRSVPAPVERFTIGLRSFDQGAALTFAWGTKELSLPVQPKQ